MRPSKILSHCQNYEMKRGDRLITKNKYYKYNRYNRVSRCHWMDSLGADVYGDGSEYSQKDSWNPTLSKKRKIYTLTLCSRAQTFALCCKARRWYNTLALNVLQIMTCCSYLYFSQFPVQSTEGSDTERGIWVMILKQKSVFVTWETWEMRL